MQIDIVTVFPEMVRDALNHSIVRRAMERDLVRIRVINLRAFTRDRHKTTDDVPYGGGGGMVMKIEPIARALAAVTLDADSAFSDDDPFFSDPTRDWNSLETLEADVERMREQCRTGALRVVLTDPRGPTFNQTTARRWAREPRIVLLCGHYEGVDDRVRQHLITDEVSIGDYILTGGELPALVITDALTRLQAGALGDAEAPAKDSFAENLLEYPHYTRPRDFLGWSVPDILLCGHHAQIENWRRLQQIKATRERRPDLFERISFSPQDRKLMMAEPAPGESAACRADSDSNAIEKYEETDGTGI